MGQTKVKNTVLGYLLIALMTCSTDLSFAQIGTWTLSTIATTTAADVGIGDVNPDGKTEVHYCGWHKNGLIVTLTNDCPINSGNGNNGGGANGEGNGTNPINLSTGLTVIGARNLVVRPLSWGRLESVDLLDPAVPPTYKTRYSFLPSGFNGFNIENPRASIDVIDPQYIGNENKVAAIFGALNNHWSMPTQFSRHIHLVPNLGFQGYNSISQQGDLGIFYTDGNNQGANSTAGLVLAPWNDNTGGVTQEMGIRITSSGNVGIGTPLINNPFGYKLAVNGVIGAKEVRVEQFSGA